MKNEHKRAALRRNSSRFSPQSPVKLVEGLEIQLLRDTILRKFITCKMKIFLCFSYYNPLPKQKFKELTWSSRERSEFPSEISLQRNSQMDILQAYGVCHDHIQPSLIDYLSKIHTAGSRLGSSLLHTLNFISREDRREINFSNF